MGDPGRFAERRAGQGRAGKAREGQGKAAQSRETPAEFVAGDRVLLRNRKRDDRKGGGMETAWSKKIYTVHTAKGRSVFIQKDECGAILKKGVNGCHLKKFYE